jgi:transposase-like protein
MSRAVTTDIGKVDLRVPRDRNGSFEPVTVAKGQRRLAGLSANVISLYTEDMTTGDIQPHALDIYGDPPLLDQLTLVTSVMASRTTDG